jgi:hypothetical protein
LSFQKTRIKKFILLIIVAGFSFSVIGCGSLPSFLSDEFKEKYKTDYNGNAFDWEVISDRNIYLYSGIVINALQHDADWLRWIRKSSSTVGVSAALFGTGLHGAFKSDEDTLTIVAAVSAIMPMLQNIWDAGGSSKAKEQGVKLIRDARVRFITSTDKGQISRSRTQHGSNLLNSVEKSLNITRDLIAQTIPSLDDLKIAMGEIEKAHPLKVVPDKVSINNVDDKRTIRIINGRVISASTDKSSIVTIVNRDSIADGGSDRVEIKGVPDADSDSGVAKGSAEVTIYDIRGRSIVVKVKVSNTPPEANAGSYNNPVEIGATVTLNGEDSWDPDKDKLVKYTWHLEKPTKSNATLSNISSKRPNFTADVAGKYKVDLIVHDGIVPSAKSTEATIDVRPNASAGESRDVEVDTEVTLKGVGGTEFEWKMFAPDGSIAELDDKKINNPKFTPDKVGVYKIELIVKEDGILSKPANITIKAQPVATVEVGIVEVVAGETTVVVGTTMNLKGSGAVNYSWLLVPPEGSNAKLDDNTISTPSFVADIKGNYKLSLWVNEGNLVSKPAEIIITAIPATLTVSITDASMSENGGSSTATVIRNTDTTNALLVNLSSNDANEATVPATVAIAAGQTTSAAFAVTAMDDTNVDGDGTQVVTITASEDNHASGTDTINVTDDDTAMLTISIVDDSISENGGSSTVTVTRNTDTTNALVVNLLSNDASVATVPTTVAIAAGQATSPSFEVAAVNNATKDGTQVVTVTASAEDHTGGSDTINVDDDD